MRDGGTIILVIVVLLCVFVGKAITMIPFIPLLIVASVFLFIFSFVYTARAMIFLIFAMLLSPEIVLGAVSRNQDITVRIDDLLIVIFMLAWLARSALDKNARFITKTPLNRLIFFYTAVFLFSTMRGMIIGDVQPLKGFFFVFKYIEYFMVFYLVAGIIRDRKQLVSYLKAFLIVFAIVNVYAMSQVGHVDRVAAPFEGTGEPNTLGGYQVLLLAVVLGILTHTKLRLWRWPMIALAFFTLIPFGYTLSRASYAALFPMYLTLIVFSKSSAKLVLTGTLILGAILFFVFKPANIMNRLTDAVTPEYQEDIPTVKIFGVTLGPSGSARVGDWIELLQAWKSKPFFGFGVTGVRFVDSQFIKVLAETGLVGFCAFMFLMFSIFKYVFRIYKNTKDDLYKGLALGFLAGHVGMLVHAITANTFIIIRIMEPYWFLAAMVMLIPELEKRKTEGIRGADLGPQPKHYINNVQFLLNSGWKR